MPEIRIINIVYHFASFIIIILYYYFFIIIKMTKVSCLALIGRRHMAHSAMTQTDTRMQSTDTQEFSFKAGYTLLSPSNV